VRSFAKLSPDERKHRWRLLAIGNTVGGVVVAVFALLFLGMPGSAVLVALMVIGVTDTWYLDWRLRRTGNLFKIKTR
jgi:hypothetical protein